MPLPAGPRYKRPPTEAICRPARALGGAPNMRSARRDISILILIATAWVGGCVEDDSGGEARGADLSPSASTCTAVGTDAACATEPGRTDQVDVLGALQCLEVERTAVFTTENRCTGEQDCTLVKLGRCQLTYAVPRAAVGRATSIEGRIDACQVGFDFGPCGWDPDGGLAARCVEGNCSVSLTGADAGPEPDAGTP